MAERRRFPWHIVVFLAPAVLVFTAVMIFPLFNTLRLALFSKVDQERVFVGLQNFQTLFGDPIWADQFWNALGNNFWFFLIHMLVQNPIGVALAAILSHPRLRFAAFYRSAIFIPTILSFVIVGFAWKLILSPIWGIAPSMLDAVGLRSLFAPWLGKEAYALTTLALVSVWQFVGIPMMLIYAALLSIPDYLDPDIRRKFQCFRSDLHGAGCACRPGFLNRHPGHFSLPDLLWLPTSTGRSAYGIGERIRHVRDHFDWRLCLSFRHPDTHASVSDVKAPL